MNQQNIVGCIFGNKVDLEGDRRIEKSQAEELATKLKLIYTETSALTGQNVENAFYQLAKALIDLHKYLPMNN